MPLPSFVGTGFPDFTALSDFVELDELVFVFELANSGAQGTVYLDNIRFTQ